MEDVLEVIKQHLPKDDSSVKVNGEFRKVGDSTLTSLIVDEKTETIITDIIVIKFHRHHNYLKQVLWSTMKMMKITWEVLTAVDDSTYLKMLEAFIFTL